MKLTFASEGRIHRDRRVYNKSSQETRIPLENCLIRLKRSFLKQRGNDEQAEQRNFASL